MPPEKHNDNREVTQPNQSESAETGAKPNRLCIGCRRHGLRSELVRLVCRDATAPQIVVDNRKTAPGRGAWLHQSQSCFELAVRRRAFARALRVQNADWSNVKSYFMQNLQNEKINEREYKEMAAR